MKTPAQKIADLALIKAIGMFIADDEQLKAYRKLQRALDKGKGDAPAMNYCDPYQLYEYDSVKNIVEEIDNTQIGLLEFASQAATIATKKRKDQVHVQNVLKVIDVNPSEVSEKTIEFLQAYYRVYIDTMENIAEDLLDIVTASEPDALSKSKHKVVREEIKKLAQTAANHDAAYVRFVLI